MTLEGEIPRDIARWLICGMVVLAAHGGAAGVLATWHDADPAGAPQSAVLLELAPVSASPPAEKADVAPDVVDQKADPEPTPEPLDKVEKVELEPPREDVKQPELKPEPPPPVKQAEVVLPKPEPPKPKPVQKQRTAAIETRRVSSEVASEHAASASSGARGDAKAAYMQQIVAHLQRHKSYPAAARANHVEGTVTVTFTLNRGGSVIASHIARGSGSAELDREALEMLKRAQPFPAPPPGLSDAQFPFTAPMRYYLR